MECKIPKCECGTKLDYMEISSQERVFEIKKDGKPFKKPLRVHGGDVQQSGLYCRRCGNTYEVDSYSTGAMLRGRLIL